MAPLSGPSFQRWVPSRATSQTAEEAKAAATTTTTMARVTRTSTVMMNRPAAVMLLVAAVVSCMLVGQISAAKDESEGLSGGFSAAADTLLDRAKRDNSDKDPQLSLHKRSAQGAARESPLHEKETDIEETVLSREKRNDPETALSREKRVVASEEIELSRKKRFDTDVEEPELSRQKRFDNEVDEPELSRQKRFDNNIEEPELSRQKRFDSEVDEQELSRQKRFDNNIDEPELSRQKRFDNEVDEPVLSRQKRFDNNIDEPELSRQKRFDNEVDEPELSRQKRFDNNIEEPELSRQKRVDSEVDEQELSRQKRFDNNIDEPELSRQKRFDNEVDEPVLSRQKRFDNDIEEPELSRQKRFDNDIEEPELSRQKRFDNEVDEPELSRQKRFDNDIEAPELYRQKRDELEVESEKLHARQTRVLLEVKEPDANSDYATPSIRTRDLLDKTSALKVTKEQPAKRAVGSSGPEHWNYHNELLARRMNILKMENKRRGKNKTQEINPEDEDDWEHELRIRRELAETAVRLGIERMKERRAHPELYNQEMSLLQRIKKDAEDILAKRAQEVKLGIRPVVQQPTFSILDEPEFDETEQEEGEGVVNDGETDLEKIERKKSRKIVRNLRFLGERERDENTFDNPIFPPLKDSMQPLHFNSREDLVERIRKSMSKGKKKRKNRKKKRFRH